MALSPVVVDAVVEGLQVTGEQKGEWLKAVQHRIHVTLEKAGMGKWCLVCTQVRTA